MHPYFPVEAYLNFISLPPTSGRLPSWSSHDRNSTFVKCVIAQLMNESLFDNLPGSSQINRWKEETKAPKSCKRGEAFSLCIAMTAFSKNTPWIESFPNWYCYQTSTALRLLEGGQRKTWAQKLLISPASFLCRSPDLRWSFPAVQLCFASWQVCLILPCTNFTLSGPNFNLVIACKAYVEAMLLKLLVTKLQVFW